jgi:hypothetical protein
LHERLTGPLLKRLRILVVDRDLLQSLEALTAACERGEERAFLALQQLSTEQHPATVEGAADAFAHSPRHVYFDWWRALKGHARLYFLLRTLRCRVERVFAAGPVSLMRESNAVEECLLTLLPQASSQAARLEFLGVVERLPSRDLLEHTRHWMNADQGNVRVALAELLLDTSSETLTAEDQRLLRAVEPASEAGVRARCLLIRLQEDPEKTHELVGELARHLRYAGHRAEEACALVEEYGGEGEHLSIVQTHRSRILQDDWFSTRLAACALRLGDASAEEELLEDLSASRVDVAIAAVVGLLLAGSMSSIVRVFDRFQERPLLAESDALRLVGRRIDEPRVEALLSSVPPEKWPRVGVLRFFAGIDENPRLDVRDALFQCLDAII